MKRVSVRRKEGDIFIITLPDGSYGYGRVLVDPFYAFYDLKTKEPINDLVKITSSKILFKLAVMKYAITSGGWKILGNIKLDEYLKEPPILFGQSDVSNFFWLEYWDGTQQDSTFEECMNLERAAVWEPEHVESRLEDYFAGRPNKWVESLRAKKV